MRACVGLLAQLFHLNESRLAYYLDLYWQVRQAYEKAEEEERRREFAQRAYPPVQPLAEDAPGQPPLGKGAEEENAAALPPEMSADDEPNVFVVDPAEVGMSADIPTDEDKAPDDTVQPGFIVYEKPKTERIATPACALTRNDEAAAVEREPGPAAKAAMEIPKVKRPERVGNTAAHDAAMFKRQVRDRLTELRSKGVTSADILAAAPKNGPLTQDRLMAILSARLAGIEVYRVLDEVLTKFEGS